MVPLTTVFAKSSGIYARPCIIGFKLELYCDKHAFIHVTAVPTCAMEAMNKIPVFDIVSCELYINPKREYLMQKYFKMVVSIPGEVESPTYGWFVKQFTEKVLSSNSESSLLNQVRSSNTNIHAFYDMKLLWENHS